jgi:hypothetical protein
MGETLKPPPKAELTKALLEGVAADADVVPTVTPIPTVSATTATNRRRTVLVTSSPLSGFAHIHIGQIGARCALIMP